MYVRFGFFVFDYITRMITITVITLIGDCCISIYFSFLSTDWLISVANPQIIHKSPWNGYINFTSDSYMGFESTVNIYCTVYIYYSTLKLSYYLRIVHEKYNRITSLIFYTVSTDLMRWSGRMAWFWFWSFCLQMWGTRYSLPILVNFLRRFRCRRLLHFWIFI